MYDFFFEVFEVVIQCQLFLLLIYNLQILYIFNTDNSLYAEKVMYKNYVYTYLHIYIHSAIFCNIFCKYIIL